MAEKKAAGKAGWRFDNSYARLPEGLFTRLAPTPVRAPGIVMLNEPLAESLGLDPEALRSGDGAAVLAGNRLPEGAEPLAQAYAGHQFGHFTMLGDGRAILLGEQLAPDGRRYDIQLKGSGITPYSRRGDGRAALGPMLREYLISEAMHALGIPTTRSLAVAATGEPVVRETVLAGAVLTRVAASHLRVGTFQYAAAFRPVTELRELAEYALRRHFPEKAGETGGDGAGEPGAEGTAAPSIRTAERAMRLMQAVVARQAELIAGWMLVGFIHGVMNTDNMAISGETIDYGPCAFMDRYDPATVFSSIDTYGRYAYGNQPAIAAWNLARFAETLLPLLHDNENRAIRLAEEAVNGFAPLYHRFWLDGMRRKLGLFNEEPEDEALVEELLALMKKYEADYTNTFRALTLGQLDGAVLFETETFAEWSKRWKARLARQEEPEAEARRLMKANNPGVIPRNHRVEEALAAAVDEGDDSVLRKLLDVLSDPYAYAPGQEAYASPPAPSNRPYRTFCGT